MVSKKQASGTVRSYLGRMENRLREAERASAERRARFSKRAFPRYFPAFEEDWYHPKMFGEPIDLSKVGTRIEALKRGAEGKPVSPEYHKRALRSIAEEEKLIRDYKKTLGNFRKSIGKTPLLHRSSAAYKNLVRDAEMIESYLDSAAKYVSGAKSEFRKGLMRRVGVRKGIEAARFLVARKP